MNICPICTPGITYKDLEKQSKVICSRCGEYIITGTALGMIRNAESSGNPHFTPRQVANISGWLKENPGFTVSSNNFDFLKNIPTPSFHERCDKFLLKLESLTSYAGEKLEQNESWLAMAWAINVEELYEILNYLISSAFLIDHGSVIGTARVKIGPAGWARLETLRSVNRDSSQGFVAMWFDPQMQQIYEDAIFKGIRNAGFMPHRVDLREHNDKIDDEIVAQIRRSRFVLADFTGHRGGVYFEAGFAKGLGLEVIWTCREDHLDDLHFDIRQYNCITWKEDDLVSFSKRITYRIEAVLGRGPLV